MPEREKVDERFDDEGNLVVKTTTTEAVGARELLPGWLSRRRDEAAVVGPRWTPGGGWR